MDWNPLKFKILGVWLTVDVTDCEEINYNDTFSEIILFRNWRKTPTTPSGRIAVLKSLIASARIHVWMDSLIVCKNCVLNLCETENRITLAEKTVIKSTKKGGLGLHDFL